MPLCGLFACISVGLCVCVCGGGDCMMYMCFVPKGKTAAIQYNTKISLIDCLLATETSV